MKNVLPSLLIAFTALLPFNLFAIKGWNKVQLAENEHIELILHHYAKADLADKDWLKIEFKNKTSNPITIEEIDYQIDQVSVGQNNYGIYHRASKYDLLHFYYDLKDPYQKNTNIDANSSLFAWKHLSNYTGTSIDQIINIDQLVCVDFNIDFEYQLENNKYEIVCKQKKFCLDWKDANDVNERKWVKRLRELIDETHHGSVNNTIMTHLMERPKILEKISTKKLIKGILSRNGENSEQSVLLLKELRNRNKIPNKKLTEYYRGKIKADVWEVIGELGYYWDSNLTDDLLIHWDSKFAKENILDSEEFFIETKQTIFEVNSQHWKTDTSVANRYFRTMKKIQLQKPPIADSLKMVQWTSHMKELAISRSRDFIDYIKPFLDDESEFEIELPIGLTSRPGHYFKSKKIKHKVRICDVAFVALLRALDQIDLQLDNHFSFRSHSFPVVVKYDILEKKHISSLEQKFHNFFLDSTNMHRFELYLKLTPEYKKKVLEMID